MEKPIKKTFDFGEYVVNMTYYGDGKLDISVLDESGDEIEGMFITNLDNEDGFNYTLN